MWLTKYSEISKLFDEEYKKTAKLIRYGEIHLDNLAEGFAGADKVIWKLPTVDAEPVVRCKNCIFKFTPSQFGYLMCTLLQVPMKDDDYCSYGERRYDAAD